MNDLKRIRIAWLTPYPPIILGRKATGSRIRTLAEALIKEDEIDIKFIAMCPGHGGLGYVDHHTRVLTKSNRYYRKFPNWKVFFAYREAIANYEPHIVHVWGTEWPGSMLAFRVNEKEKILISILGIAKVVRRKLWGTRNISGIIRWLTPHDLLASSGIVRMSKTFKKIERMEVQAMRTAKYFDCATSYMESWVKRYNPQAKVFHCPSLLRPAFYQDTWSLEKARKDTIFLPDAVTTYKAFDVMLRAANLLTNEYPNLQIRVSGPIPRRNYVRTSGYERFVRNLASKESMIGKVEFLGPLNAEEMAQEMLLAHCVVISSLEESQSLVLCEAMALGLPIVVPFAGGMPDLFAHMISAVGYLVANPVSLANGIRRIFSDDEFAKVISRNSKRMAVTRHEPSMVINQMKSIYYEIVGIKPYSKRGQ